MYKFLERNNHIPYIKVIGVGGGGGNALNNMSKNEIRGVEFISINTDIQSLYNSFAKIKIQLGYSITKGLGTGSRPEVGEISAKESLNKIEGLLLGADVIFITCGLGGGTGTGACPIIASVSQKLGILTIGVVTTPFSFEGSNRCKISKKGVVLLNYFFDTLIIIPNNKLIKIVNKNTSMVEAFKLADETLYNAIKCINDIIIKQGIINVDFADTVSIMGNKGIALIGIGIGSGRNRSITAVEKAIMNPLFEDLSIEDCENILINITGGFSLTLFEINCIVSYISKVISESANILFGYVIDKNLYEKIYVTIIATGFDFIKKNNNFFFKDNNLGNKFIYSYKIFLFKEKKYFYKIVINILSKNIYNEIIINHKKSIKKLIIFKNNFISNDVFESIENFYIMNKKNEFNIEYYIISRVIL